MKEYFIHDDGIRLHAKLETPSDAEKCPLALLIHGFTGHMEEPHLLAVRDTLLSCGIAVLRVEMYGHGQSDGSFEDHTLLKWVNNAIAAADHARELDFVTDLYLCGHSQGGLLAILLAGLKPDLFRAVIPLAPATSIAYGARVGNVLGMTFDPDHIPDVIFCGERRLKGNYLRAAQLVDVDQAISRYHGPVLLVHGDADASVPLQCSIDAQKQYDNGNLVIIPGDTHCYDHHLDKVTAAVKDFLETVLCD